MSAKALNWQKRHDRKLRVAFVDDSFWAYVDLPDRPRVQKAYEDDLRKRTGGKVSLYHPGSPYRDAETPFLDEHNLEVWLPTDGATPNSTQVTERSEPTTPATTLPPQPRPLARSAREDGCTFSSWWTALAAVPPSREALDWWAKYDGRATPYARLKRVWFDTTRCHWFYRIDQEDHLTATLWENFSLFSPADWLPAVTAAAGLPPLQSISDACWSYEFEERVNGHLKQIDVTVHYRDAEGDGLIIVEAKRPGGSLKPTDADPRYYHDLPSFAFTDRRATIYLVDAHDLSSARSTVTQDAQTVGFLTWQRLGELQVELTDALPLSPSLKSLLRNLIQWQFDRHGFPVQSNTNYPNSRRPLRELLNANATYLNRPTCGGTNGVSAEEVSDLIDAALEVDTPHHVRAFLAGAIQHQAACCGTLPTRPAHAYLADEPTREQIVPGMESRQRTADRRAPLWRLP